MAAPTLAEMMTQVRDILDEPVAGQYTDTQLRRWLQEGNRDLARSTRHIKANHTIYTIGNLGTYATPTNVMAIEHAWYYDVAGNRHIPLYPKHMENMDSVRGYQWTLTGTPAFYTTQGFSPQLQILVYPTPTVTANQIIIYTAEMPAEWAIDGSDDAKAVSTPVIWYDALADYCEMKALRKDRDPRWQEPWQMYQEKRDGLINNPDYLAVNRELIPDPRAGYLPRWLVETDGSW